MKNSAAIEDENGSSLPGREQLLYSRKPFYSEPNTQTTYCTLHGNLPPHIKSENIRKSRKFHTSPSNFKTEHFGSGPNETFIAAKFGHDTKGTYCGLLSEYAKGTGEFANQNDERAMESSRLLQKYDPRRESYGANVEDSWRFYQKSKLHLKF